MNKKIISLMTSIFLTFSSYTSMNVHAQQTTEAIQFSTDGKIVEGRTYVPIQHAATTNNSVLSQKQINAFVQKENEANEGAVPRVIFQ